MLTQLAWPRPAAGYIDEIKQVVEAEYGEELFDKLPLPDGSVYNVALDVPGTLGFEKKLQTALEPLRNKLRGLCSGSYKGFGKQRDKKVSKWSPCILAGSKHERRRVALLSDLHPSIWASRRPHVSA